MVQVCFLLLVELVYLSGLSCHRSWFPVSLAVLFPSTDTPPVSDKDRLTPMADLPVACCWFVHRQIHAPFHACRCGGWAVLVTACSVQGVFSGYTYIHCAPTVIYREDLPTPHVPNVSEATMDNNLRELFSNLGHVA